MKSHPVLKTILFLLLPVAELVCLRLYLHQGLGLRIGFPGFTDYELIFPAPLGFLAFVMALEQAEKIKIEFQSRILAIHSVLLLAFILVNQFYESGFSSFGGLWSVAWWTLLISLVLSAFFVWTSPKRILTNPHFWSIGPSLLMVFSLVLYMKFGAPLWEVAVKKLEWAFRTVLHFSGNEIIKVSAMRKYLRLHHPLQTVFVGQGCGGFDGILFFCSAFSIFAPLNWALLKKRTWFFALLTGVGFFTVLNLLRVLSIFTLAILANQLLGKEMGRSLVLGMFHTHAGYLIYAFGVILFFSTIKAIAATQRKDKRKKITSSYQKIFADFFGIRKLRKAQNQP
jgi:exosortase/archaeosortase family protein